MACFGQCALAPVVEVNHRILGHVNEQVLERSWKRWRKRPGVRRCGPARVRRQPSDDSTPSPGDFRDAHTRFRQVQRGKEAGLAKLLPAKPRVAVGMGTCGTGNGAEAVYHAFADAIGQRGLDIQLTPVGCFGFCAQEPLVASGCPAAR